MLLERQREKVIEIAQRAYREKLAPLTAGNFSLRDRETGLVCITPSGMNYELLKPDDIVVVDVDGNIKDGKRKPSIELHMHCATYRKRPDVFGIAHTHSVFATAWACCGEAIPAVVAELASTIGGAVECAPYRPMGSMELAETVAEHLGGKNAVLMANHGVLAVGYDIDSALANVLMVEEGARIAFYARQIGNVRTIPDEECQHLMKIMQEKYGQR